MTTAHVLVLLPLLATAGRADVAGNPRVTHGSATVDRLGSETAVRLRAASRLEWSDFTVRAGETLRYLSEGGPHASLNLVRGATPAAVHGQVLADGPFYLISPSGIHVGRGGRIQAPRVFLSALAAEDDLSLAAGHRTSFSKSGSGLVVIDGAVGAGSGLTVLGASISIGPEARLSAPGGSLQILAADASAATGPDAGGRFDARSSGGSSLVNSEGSLEARRIEIISDGFIRNGGRVTSTGPGNQVRLAASEVRHDLRPGNASVISTSKLDVVGAFTREGPVLFRQDGANPSGVGGLRQTPRLSGTGFVTTLEARATRLSYSPLHPTRPATSPIPPRPATPATLAARRGADSEAPDPTKKKPAGSGLAAGAVRKASFFGQVFSRP